VFRDENGILFTLDNPRYSEVVQAGRDLEEDGVGFWVEQREDDE
jgi:hypothetical protein